MMAATTTDTLRGHMLRGATGLWFMVQVLWFMVYRLEVRASAFIMDLLALSPKP